MDLENILLRVVAIGKEALLSLTPPITADGKPYLYVHDRTPYFCTRISSSEMNSESEEINANLYTVELRLIMGKVTEGYDGEIQGKLYRYMPTITAFLQKRIFLQSATYTTRPADLLGAYYRSCGGLQVWADNSGSGTAQFGTSFLIECQFQQSIDRDYF